VRTASIPARFPARTFHSKRLLALASDAKLVEHIRRGNEAAFEVAFERHAAGILGFSRHMLGSPEEAEDVVQHTFTAAFGELGRGGHRELALKPWLYTIARNRCVSLLRSRREHATEELDVATRGLAEEVERRTELREMLRDLLDLPDEQREALLLSEAGDLSHAEVAKVLGCEVTKVKALVFRARNGLIQRRAARETPCSEIREQLATLRGGSLRRGPVRHHLRRCEGCRAYREQVKHQRRMLAAALPMAPSLALKSSVLGALGLGGGSAGGGLAAGLAGLGAGASAPLGGATVAKVALVGVLAAGGAVAGKSAVDDTPPQRAAEPPTPAVEPGRSATGPAERSISGPAAPDRGRPLTPGTYKRPAYGDRGRLLPGAADARAERGIGGRALHGPARAKRDTHARVRDRATPPMRDIRGRGRDATARSDERQDGGGGRGRGPIDTPRADTSNGRGAVDAPPVETPVRRGPPEPTPSAERLPPATPKGPAAARGPQPQAAADAESAPEPAVEPAPAPRTPEKAPKE
jgi:RNA polymerase sigma factor (sigma-70 family)